MNSCGLVRDLLTNRAEVEPGFDDGDRHYIVAMKVAHVERARTLTRIIHEGEGF